MTLSWTMTAVLRVAFLTWAATTLVFVCWKLFSLIKNYFKARKIGLPILVIYASWLDPLWLLYFSKKFEWLSQLPFGLGYWVKYSQVGWTLRDRYDIHQRLGNAFVLVSPVSVELMIADPTAAAEVTAKYNKWLRPRELYTLFELFGPNVDSVNGKDWQRHRKIVSHGFKEQNNKLVWEAGSKQARQMLQSMPSAISLEGLASKFDTVAIHVLSYAGFGHDYSFDRSSEPIPSGHTQKFADALFCICINIFPAWIMKSVSLPMILTPAWLKSIKIAHKELSQYFDEALEERKGDFVQSLAIANEQQGQNEKLSLSNIEVHGNLFVIQLAGFETSSNALLYSLGLLATEPDVQNWVAEEVQELRAYEEGFPRVRCLAVMYETLRRYGAAPGLIRFSPQDETLAIDGKEVLVPAGTLVTVNMPALHNDPKIWGDDANEWKPKRWIEKGDGVEKLKDPPEAGLFMPWSTGPRVCPGKKFSQVEFVSVISNILSQYRVEGSRNLWSVLDDFEFRTTPKPKHPNKADLIFSPRTKH